MFTDLQVVTKLAMDCIELFPQNKLMIEIVLLSDC